MPLSPGLLLRAYASGIFPMAESAEAGEVYWVEPEKRGILPLDGFHLSKSLVKTLKSGRFTISINTAFEAVLRACAQREETWINAAIHNAMCALHT
ncbi:MAG: leucyl/phenylalanyl-tRNA--protein transferase, partial [Alphaproteobacteria bacterium]|nr:leucyl/phenylalanyl-tRNA--protein transferase [Alphaproteobacteria bacterium]